MAESDVRLPQVARQALRAVRVRPQAAAACASGRSPSLRHD